jgi:hypothetical protein
MVESGNSLPGTVPSQKRGRTVICRMLRVIKRKMTIKRRISQGLCLFFGKNHTMVLEEKVVTIEKGVFFIE